MMSRLNRFFTQIGYYRAAGEMRRQGHDHLAKQLELEAKKL